MSDPVRPEWLWDEKKVSDNLLMFNNPNSSEREQARVYIEHQEAERAKWLRKASDLAGDNAHLEAEKERQSTRYGDLLAEFKRQSVRIAELEAIERNLRESCEILRNMDAEKNTRIAELEARYVKDCEQITRLWERLGEYRRRIKELEKPPAEVVYADEGAGAVAVGPEGKPVWERSDGTRVESETPPPAEEPVCPKCGEQFIQTYYFKHKRFGPIHCLACGYAADQSVPVEPEPMCVCGHSEEDHFGDSGDLFTPCRWECDCPNYKPEGGK